MLILKNAEELLSCAGKKLPTSAPLAVTQERINQFADATNDTQWIHVSPEKAQHGPFGRPVAHGFLTLSLLTYFLSTMLKVEGIARAVNYGCDKVRFPHPVREGEKVRASGEVLSAHSQGEGVRVEMRLMLGVEGAPKPCCVADLVVLYFFAPRA